MEKRSLVKILKELSLECEKNKGNHWTVRLAQILLDEYNKDSTDIAVIQYRDYEGEDDAKRS